YRDTFTPAEAVNDLAALQQLEKDTVKIRAHVYRRQDDPQSTLRLKLYGLGPMLPLSASLPVFENLGLQVIAEDSYPVALTIADGGRADAAVLDFSMERRDEG